MNKFNNIYKGLAGAFMALTLTGCIQETVPMGGTVTDEQVQQSSSATESMVMGMPSKSIEVWRTDSHCYFGYPAQMIIRDMMTNDYYHSGELGYSHFKAWAENRAMGGKYMNTQFHWNFYYSYIMSVNSIVSAVDPENATDDQKGYLGCALAQRAMLYLDIARMYEFLPNELFADGKNEDGNSVLGLTVPYVDEKLTPEEARNNKRLPHDEMVAKIKEDIEKAKEYIVYSPVKSDYTLPDLGCVYGLEARLLMWDAAYQAEVNADDAKSKELYAAAAVAAGNAISNSRAGIITQEKGLSTTSGFNTLTDFMWGAQQTEESDCVQTGIINFPSWVTNQTSFGYTGAATSLYVVVDKNLYDQIGDNDWRKAWFVAPSGSTATVPNQFIETVGKPIAYASIKFRPAKGDAEKSSVGACTAVPYMRVEEMYFIKAEAEARTGGNAAATLTEIMKTRDASYTTNLSGDALINEIILQKRIELWGEGQTYFDIKRLNLSVTRGYKGTTCTDTKACFNTNGRPAWMNYVMVGSESDNNEALVGFNNPDPSDKYNPWSE